MATPSLPDLILKSTGASIDSRTIRSGQIFFALAGNKTDGTLYAARALEAGALLAVVNKDSHPYRQDDRYYVVDDVLDTMQTWALAYRRYLKIPVMAITGSNGKTTNKNLLATALATRYRVHSTAGNFNNHIGLPLTILNAPTDTEFLLLEMGTNHFGEIRDLCRIGEPDFGSIVNVGKSHLEFLQSIEGVLRAKSELADYLSTREGLLFLNLGEPSLRPLLDHPVKKIILDRDRLPGLDYRVEVRQSVPDIILDVMSPGSAEKYVLRSSLWGEHNVHNLIHALGVSSHFGVEMEAAVDALSRYEATDNRSQIIEWKGHRVYLDAYNANPSSMAHAIRGFRSSHPDQGILILGEMGELGKAGAAEHESILDMVDSMGFDLVYLVGDQFYRSGRSKYPRFHYVSDVLELADNDWAGEEPVLIKGSRFLALERLVDD